MSETQARKSSTPALVEAMREASAETRREILEEVFTALTKCPVYRLVTVGPAGVEVLPSLGMKREDLSAALASLNGGVIPRPAD